MAVYTGIGKADTVHIFNRIYCIGIGAQILHVQDTRIQLLQKCMLR